MKRQRNTTLMKEQTKITEVQINEGEIGKLPEKEFRMIVKMIKTLKTKWRKCKNQLKDLEELKNKHTEINNTVMEIKKNTLEGINSRISEAEEGISELEDKMVEIISKEQNKLKRMKRTEDSLRVLWDNIKHTSI